MKNTTKEDILVTISCATYNHEAFISEAIESFLKQKTNFKYEILIHDDASTDKTPLILREYEKKYPDLVRVIYQQENQYSKGKMILNILDKEARGKYIAICEGDDYWIDENKLQKQIDYLENNSKCGLCFHTVAILDNKLNKKVREIKPYKKSQVSPTKDIILGGGGFIGTNSIIYRKEVMLDPPKFYLDSPVGDYPLQIINSMKEYAYFIEDTMSVYRVNTGISWTDKNKSYIKEKELNLKLIEMLDKFNEYSNFKYKQEVFKKIEQWCYVIIKYYQKENLEITKSEYLYFYSRLGFRRKLKVLFNKILVKNK